MAERCARETAPGLHVVRLPRDGFTEMFITVSAIAGEEASETFRRLDDYLRENEDARVVRKDVFGPVDAVKEHLRPEERCGVEFPVTRVEAAGCGGSPVAGIYLHAVAGAAVEPIRMDGRVVGTAFEDAYARYCLLGDIRPGDAGLPREEQAREAFEMMERALREVDMDFSHVVRTWLYLDDILSWYREFNGIRNTFFAERGVFDGLVPASTGVGGRNAAGAGLVAGSAAVAVRDGRVRVRSVPSPLQCPAPEYGSSFSRAVEVAMPDHRRLLVSGTASIDPDGRTVHIGDADAQVALTMRVVNAILESRGMGWSDVSRATAYLKRAEDAPAFDRYVAENGIAPLPVLVAESDICRDELLFEIEVDAVLRG